MKNDVLKKLVEINTIGDLENEKIREYIKYYLRSFNFSFQEFGEETRKVLIAKRGEPDVGFICHTDTVGDSKYWEYNPLALTEDDEYFYGLGVSDMKGGIAALLEAITKIDISVPCMICFTYDEECTFLGVNELVKAKAELPRTLVFTEPTDLELVIANKGCIEFEVNFVGRSAHSSTPELGDNALYKAMDFINELRLFADKIREERLDLYEIGYTTFNLSKISGGDEINKVPDNCTITFDFRTIKKEHNDKIKKAVEVLCKKYGAKSKNITDLNASFNTSNEIIAKFKKFASKEECIGLNYVTEASFFKDKNIFILGPGPVTAHQPDEKISKKSYKKTIDIYNNILIGMNK